MQKKSPGLNGLGFLLERKDKGFANCCVGVKFETPKSCDIQTFYAITKENRAVTGLARNSKFRMAVATPHMLGAIIFDRFFL